LVKFAFHDTNTDTDWPNTATVLRPTHAISSREEVGVSVGVGIVECHLNPTKKHKHMAALIFFLLTLYVQRTLGVGRSELVGEFAKIRSVVVRLGANQRHARLVGVKRHLVALVRLQLFAVLVPVSSSSTSSSSPSANKAIVDGRLRPHQCTTDDDNLLFVFIAEQNLVGIETMRRFRQLHCSFAG